MPGMDSLLNGDIGRKRTMLTEVSPRSLDIFDFYNYLTDDQWLLEILL